MTLSVFKKFFLFFLPFIFLFFLLGPQEKSFTQDLGRHLKTGEIIIKNHSVPMVNMFSFTEPNYPFINHHWLSEVVFYLFSQINGISSLIGLKSVIITLSFGMLFIICYRKNSFWASVVSLPYLYIFSERFDVRPELFSFLFTSLFLVCIYYFIRTKSFRLLLLLPLIELLWVNMHIYFIIGIILFAVLLIDQAVSYRSRIDKRLFVMFGILIFLTLINPNGLWGALEPFTILRNYGYSIVENQNIFFLNSFFFNPRILVFEITAILLLILIKAAHKRGHYFFLLSSLFALYEASAMIRNFPLFVLITYPYAVFLLNHTEEKWKNKMNLKVVKHLVLGISVVCVIIAGYQFLRSPMPHFTYVNGAEKAVQYYKAQNIRGPIFNNFDIGSYLIYALYPREKVYIDGRPEAYSVDFFKRYKEIQENEGEFRKEVERYGIRSIFFSTTDITPWAQKFLSTIIYNPQWQIVYKDDYIIILQRKIASSE